MRILSCNDGCCKLQVSKYKNKRFHMKARKVNKAGVFIIDPNTRKILIVQSRGFKWGIPKGTSEEGESPVECAKREVMEETGISLKDEDLKVCKSIYRGIYFIANMSENDVFIQNHVPENDANGIGWVNIDCLYSMEMSGKLKLNMLTYKLLDYLSQNNII